MRTRLAPLAALIAPLALAACAAPYAQRESAGPVTVGILAINDFHGNLQPPESPALEPDGAGGTRKVPAGGAAHLATAIDALRVRHENSVTVSAGDLISASPLPSSLFLDEPTVTAMNRIGLEIGAVGNHEFDRGREELLRMQRGGCAKHTLRKPCAIEPFAGADFTLLAASTYTEDGKTLFPASTLREFGEGERRVTIGFIGLTLEGTPLLVSPGGIAGLTFGDEAEAINRETALLKEQGADAVVVLIHEGAKMGKLDDGNACEGLDGAIVPILKKLDPRVDVVISGHTHQAYVCPGATGTADGPLLTSAGLYGKFVTDITLTIDPTSDRVIAREARNVIVRQDGYAARPDITAHVARYVEAARSFGEREIGKLAMPLPRITDGTAGVLGNLIADAQLAATQDAGAQIAFMNPFGIRGPLNPGADGAIRYEQIYAAQPFDNMLVTKTLSGEQILALIEQGAASDDSPQMLAPSAGLEYSVDLNRHPGSRVTALTFNGAPIVPTREYRVTTNSFLAQGGDGYSLLKLGRDAVRGPTDLDALEQWIAAEPVRGVDTKLRTSVIWRQP